MSTPPTKPIETYPAADLGDLPQPPAPAGAAVASAPTTAASAAPGVASAEVAVLEFLDPGAVRAEITLQFAFVYEGRTVTSIPVRRLNGAEVGQIANERGEAVELYDFYAAMSGYPKAVLRGLIDDDLEAFLDKARPFLCRFAKDALLSPFGENGEPSPAGPAAPLESPGPAS